MIAYLIRRMLYAIPIIMGVMVLSFVLFFVVNTPDDMARTIIGEKHANTETIAEWKREHGYDLPRFYNDKEVGARRFTSTLFFTKCARLLIFDLGRSDVSNRSIAGEIRKRMWPSLAIAVPTFLLALAVNITTALIVAFCRGTLIDRGGTVLCVLMMSISSLFYIIGGQFVFAGWLRLFPISGFDWSASMGKFIILPVVIGVIAGIGAGVRYYRTVMLEEVGRDYVRTARAKGLGEAAVLFKHVLKNAMIPILTAAIARIPFLFMGSLIMESFFAIPGLGSMTINAIRAQDFSVVRSMVFISAILYVIGLLMTDISYTLVDPRITLGAGSARRLSPLDILKLLIVLAVLAVAGWGAFVGVGALWNLPALAYIRAFIMKLPSMNLLRAPVLPNLAFIATVAGAFFFWLRARRRVLWCNAWREVRKNRLAMASLVVLAGYVSVAALDSVSWCDPDLGPDGNPRITRAGQLVLGPARSILDRTMNGLGLNKSEVTYSEPCSNYSLSMETIKVEENGEIVQKRVHKELIHPGAHLMGTDKTGEDVLYKTIKSARTGLVIGGLTTLIAVPFSIFFGVLAGFFGGWVDDLVQYIYSTIASVPWVLLVVAFMLVFDRGLTQLCVVMGITGWVGLCRVLRGEAMKLREKEYVQAALALGVSKFNIIRRHIVPNLMHLVLISVVLRFSGLVLAEAVLSYIGVGVGPDTYSWGTMIDQARSELGREPVVWWSLAAAFVAMFALVLSANLFGDALRDALDPRLRVREELK